MATTEHERLELYELAKHEVGDRFAELMMKSLPQDPDELVRTAGLAAVEQRLDNSIVAVRADLATVEQRLDNSIVAVRADLATVEQRLDARISVLGSDLRVEMRDLTSAQTRTMTLGLVGSVTALAITQIVASLITR
ncbi:hypothetical protein [Actinospongicola halichondriae]|uniref:hypothetical protein n=1 Tax=Actinospongicola halichondriae TaxID=3236844 RepID=UPI003D3785F0